MRSLVPFMYVMLLCVGTVLSQNNSKVVDKQSGDPTLVKLDAITNDEAVTEAKSIVQTAVQNDGMSLKKISSGMGSIPREIVIVVSLFMGIIVGLVIKRTRYKGNCSLSKLSPYTITLEFYEIAKDKHPLLVEQVKNTLAPYSDQELVSSIEMPSTPECHMKFSLSGVTVCPGEIHSALLAGVTIQEIEMKSSISVPLQYTSILARGRMRIELKVIASPNSIVTLEGVSQPIYMGEFGEVHIVANVKKEQIQKGFLVGKAVKGGLEKAIRIPLE